MLFSPRHSPSALRRLRTAVWPRRSFARSARYLWWRLLRLGGSAHGLALGVAIGVFVATLPILGIQLLLAGFLAWALRANVPAALLGSFWANPITLPFLWLASHWVGSAVFGAGPPLQSADVIEMLSQAGAALFTPGQQTLASVYALLWPVWKPLAAGAVLIGGVSAVLTYGLTYNLIGAYRIGRRRPVDQATLPPLTLDAVRGR